MSTRALYRFSDGASFCTVYKHHDGYPCTERGGLAHIARALPLAWPLPRFEPDEFAAAFVAANKDGAGGVRLLSGNDSAQHEADADLLGFWGTEYAYCVKAAPSGGLLVTVYCEEGNPDTVGLYHIRPNGDGAWVHELPYRYRYV